MRDPRDPRNHPTLKPHALAIAILVDAPLPGRARRGFSPPLSLDASAGLERAMISDLVGALGILPFRHRLILAPPDPDGRLALTSLATGAWKVLPQRGDDANTRLVAAFEDLFARNVEAAIVLTTDSPLVPLSEIYEGLAWMTGTRSKVLLGATEGGSCYALGSTRFEPRLFPGLDLSAPSSAEAFRARAAELSLESRPVPTVASVLIPSDLPRLARDLAARGATSAPETARLLGTAAIAPHCV